jgi:hypothetical protein
MSIAAALLLWLAAAHRLLILARHRSFLNAAYAAALVLAAVAFTVRLLQPEIDSVLGANTGDLIKHLLIVAMGAALQLFILAVNAARPSPRAISRIVALAAAVAVAMIVAFVLADATAGSADDITTRTVAYLVIFNGYLAYVLIDNIRLYRRFAAAPGDQGRAVNLRLIGWGSAIALVYSATRVLSIAAVVLTGQPLPRVESIGSFAAVLGVLFVALGVFAPRVVPWLADWHSARKGLTQLDELWTDLAATFPTVILPSGGGLGHRVEFAFDRRLVEVSECLRLAHLPATAAATVRDASNPVAALARELYRNRAHWTSGHGPVAADLLPPATSRDEDTAALLELADVYAAASRARTSVAVN